MPWPSRPTLGHLLFAVLALTAASQVVVGVWMYRRLQAQLEADLARRLVHVSTLLTFSVDAPLVVQFRAGDEALPAYSLVRRRLAAQAEAAGVARAYVLDAERRTLVDTLETQPAGRVRHALLAHRSELERSWSGQATATRLYADESGRLRLSALAPLRAHDGRVVALVGVDAPPAFFGALEVVRRELLTLGAAGVGLVALAGMWVLRQVDARLGRLRSVVTRAAHGDLATAAEPHGPDPIGALGRDLDRLIGTMVATREHHEAVLSSLDVGLLTCDAEGRVTLANPRARTLLGGSSAGGLLGRKLDDLLVGEEPLLAFVRAALDSHAAASTEVPVGGGLAAGGRVLAASISRLVREGRASGLVLSLLDVTELRLAERRARENERLAALGGMAGGLLHELGNPLAALTMYLDLLRPLTPQGEGNELLERALREDTRLHEFLEDFRVFAGLAPLRIESFDLVALSAAAVEPLAWPPGAERRINGNGNARGDVRLLAHALRNLIRNAIEALPATGGGIEVQLDREQGLARVSVSDDGVGMAPEQLDHVFEPFHTTKPHGSGLGLLIARRVAELHGGAIEARSRPAAGTCFTLRWPVGH